MDQEDERTVSGRREGCRIANHIRGIEAGRNRDRRKRRRAECGEKGDIREVRGEARRGRREKNDRIFSFTN
jgi:hypothetical protein